MSDEPKTLGDIMIERFSDPLALGILLGAASGLIESATTAAMWIEMAAGANPVYDSTVLRELRSRIARLEAAIDGELEPPEVSGE